MTQLQQMLECQQRGAAMVEHNVGYSRHAPMPGDNDSGHLRKRGQLGGVDGDNAFHQAFHEQPRILLKQVCLVSMADDKIEVPGLEQIILDAGKHQGGIAFAHFGDKHANRERLLLT